MISQRVGLSRGIEMGSKLMHASILITHAFLWFVMFSFLFSLIFLVLPLFLFMIMIPPLLMILYCSQLPPFILSVVMGFTIFTPQPLLAPYGCHSKTAHWPTSHPATTIALNVLVAPLLISRQNSLSYFFTSLCFHYSHLDKD